MRKPKQVADDLPVAQVMDSSTSNRLRDFDGDYCCLVTELATHGELQGTNLYVPGVTHQELMLAKSKPTKK